MKERYEQYVADWHLCESAETRPMTFEKWKARTEKAAAEKAAAVKAAEGIAIYTEFVQKAADVDEDDALIVARKMKSLHDDECMKLFRAGKIDEVAAHAEAYNAAKKAIMAPYKRPSGLEPGTTTAAINVYDNDDSPTTHK